MGYTTYSKGQSVGLANINRSEGPAILIEITLLKLFLVLIFPWTLEKLKNCLFVFFKIQWSLQLYLLP